MDTVERYLLVCQYVTRVSDAYVLCTVLRYPSRTETTVDPAKAVATSNDRHECKINQSISVGRNPFGI
jgi:hypothetical protein